MLSMEYIAGLVDGEGCIQLHPSNKGKYRRYYPAVQVTNTHLGVLVLLKEQFGGYVTGPKKHPNGAKKDCWDWRLTGDSARGLLRSMLPFLVIKQDKAALVLEGDQKKTK